MTADCPTDHPYVPAPKDHDPEKLRKYWSIAKGLQAVDGLEPSEYLIQLSEETIAGKRTLEESGESIRYYYFESPGMFSGVTDGEDDDNRLHTVGVTGLDTPDDSSVRGRGSDGLGHRPLKTEVAGSNAGGAAKRGLEADLVTQRIAELLARGAFMFAPEMLTHIHAYLFQDLDCGTYKPGQLKSESLLKREDILNGDSVSYADPALVEASLRIAFEDESGNAYGTTFDEEALENLVTFIARIWQVHPFVEGNTRTVAVFTVLYLNDLGYDITNEPFEHHSRYFRDALVRAIYRNPKAQAFPDPSFLIGFLDSVLNGTEADFSSDKLKVESLFDDPALLRNRPAEVE